MARSVCPASAARTNPRVGFGDGHATGGCFPTCAPRGRRFNRGPCVAAYGGHTLTTQLKPHVLRARCAIVVNLAHPAPLAMKGGSRAHKPCRMRASDAQTEQSCAKAMPPCPRLPQMCFGHGGATPGARPPLRHASKGGKARAAPFTGAARTAAQRAARCALSTDVRYANVREPHGRPQATLDTGWHALRLARARAKSGAPRR